MHQWPKLESSKLEHCYALEREFLCDDFFARSRCLKRVELFGQTEAAGWALAALPATVRHITVDDSGFLTPEIGGVPEVYDIITAYSDPYVRKLERVSLTQESPAFAFRARETSTEVERGLFNEFVANLDSVTRLTLHPSAVTDAATLASLPCLTEFRFLFGARVPWPVVKPAELVGLFRDSRSLKRVELSPEMQQDWTDKQKREVESAAKPRIDFAWV